MPDLRSKVLRSPFQALHRVSKRRARKAAAQRCWQDHGDSWGERPAPALRHAGNPSLALPPRRHGRGSAPADAAPAPGDEAGSSQLSWSLQKSEPLLSAAFYRAIKPQVHVRVCQTLAGTSLCHLHHQLRGSRTHVVPAPSTSIPRTTT